MWSRSLVPAPLPCCWAARDPLRSVVEHLEDALAAEQLSLGEDELARLEEPYVPHSPAF
jgi:hypothetical protein